MRRRDAVVSLVVTGLGVLMAPGAAAVPQPSQQDLSQDQLRMLLRELAGLELQPDEALKVLASLKSNRFTGKIDPTVQPCDFDPEVDL